MASARPRALIAVAYEEAAQAYLRSLPLEHFMEATAQATQRKITLESLDLLHARRPDVQVFNELLVQYPLPRQRRPGQVVPDNMVVLCDPPITATTSFNLPLEPAGPFWVLEYVSKSNKRKDYDDNFDKYEQQLKVPYYLIFYPDTQDLSLYHHSGKKYVAVRVNKHGRYPVAKLEVEVALLHGWVRFWYEGELLPLPAELQRELDEAKRETAELRRRLEEEREARLAAERGLAEFRARLERAPPRRGNGPKRES